MLAIEPTGKEQKIDGQQLDSIARGAVVIGAEPVSWPLTDGIYIYLRRPGGEAIALLIETDTDDPQKHELLRIVKTAAELQEA